MNSQQQQPAPGFSQPGDNSQQYSQYNYYPFPHQQTQYDQFYNTNNNATNTFQQGHTTLPDIRPNFNQTPHKHTIIQSETVILPTPTKQQTSAQPAHSPSFHHPPQDKHVIQSPLDTRIQSLLSSTNLKHENIVSRFKKIAEGKRSTSFRKSISSSSSDSDSGFCKVPPFQEFAGPPICI